MTDESSNASFNAKDFRIWDSLFGNAPDEWKAAPATASMLACEKAFTDHGVRTVLDVGCGVGIWSVFLAKAGFAVKGSDFSPKGLDFARRWAVEERLDIELKCAPVTTKPFPDERFDAIVVAKVLDNLSREEADVAVGHIHQSLADSGLVFAVFNRYFTEEDLERLNVDENPTKGVTSTSYRDPDLPGLFPDFNLLETGVFEAGFRGLLLRKIDK